MSTPATLSVMTALLGVAMGPLALRVSRLHGWREYRWFALVCLASAVYALANLGTSVSWLGNGQPVTARIQTAVGVLQFWVWMRYAEAFGRTSASRPGRWMEVVLFAVAALALVPGVVFDGTVMRHAFTGWGVVYRDAGLSSSGKVLLAVASPSPLFVLARFWRARCQRIPFAGTQIVAFSAFLALVANDSAVATGRYDWPYLLDIGTVLPVGLVFWSTALRFIGSAEDLEALRARLEMLVEQRTRALADAQEALVRAERLAALGQLGNGVAHQVSNPASVVTANLRYLSGKLAGAAEDREAADDALAAMQRINDLVRRLADAGRIAARPRSSIPVALSQVVERTLADARTRLPPRLSLDAELPPGLHVRARPEVLEQVLQSLIANAAEAVPQGRAGRIDIRAERRAGGIRLTVTDDGVGMPPEVLERAFEPFFTTKTASLGSGLGLPVSRGIVEVHGGALWLESAPERGTTAVLVLPEAPQAG
jgi:signal transduction histidine kinase